MKVSFDIKDISTYRSELMGWAIVWIMMLHFTFTQIKPLGFIAQYGFAGVEIFMFVSGFGLFFSLDKNPQLLSFYKKRVLRIFPTYYLIGIVASIILFHDNIIEYMFRYTTIGFWTGGIYWEWYVPSIIMLYISAPLIKKMIDKRLFTFIVILSIIIWALSLYIVANEIISSKEPHFFLLYRIPTFIFGMICAHWMKNKVSVGRFHAVLLIGFPCFALLFPHHHEIYNYKYLSLVFLLPLFVACFTILTKYTKALTPIISTIGNASLEIYLIQGIFFHAILTQVIIIPALWHDAFTIAFIIVCSLLGILVHWLMDKSGILRLL